MVVRAIFAVLFISLCVATELQYPKDDPCILIDFETNNSLSWTPANGTKMAIPNWDISDFEISEGNCSGEVHSLTVLFHIDNATMQFDFHNASGEVEVDIVLKFDPSIVFKSFNNTDDKPVEVKYALKAGDVGKLYKCDAETPVTGKGMAGGDEYDSTLRFTDTKMQGFGVVNGTFSKDMDECAADITTVAPNTTVTTEPTTEPTTHPGTTQKPPTSPPKVTLNATDGNVTCAMLVGEITLMVPYNDTKKTLKTATVYVPKNVKSSGKCANQNKTDTLVATFGDGWEMDFIFMGDKDNVWLDQFEVTVVYDPEHFPDIEASKAGTNMTFKNSLSKAFKAKNDGSYLCNSDATTDLKDGLKLKTKDFQYTALQSNVTVFPDKNIAECSADAKTSSIVPIAVGAALAGLVVIVLIAYLIGRRRNRKGYESV